MRQLEHREINNPTVTHPLSLLCPDWRDPRNVGSAFRLADAAGLTELLLTGSTPLPPNPKIAKTARSTVRSVSWSYHADAVGLLRERRAAGTLVLALEITDASISLFDADALTALFTNSNGAAAGCRQVIVIAGSEATGVSPEILAECDAAVHLPMFGRNTSMNVAVALGAAVYLLLRCFRFEKF